MEWRYYEWKEVIKKRTSQANTSLDRLKYMK